MSAQKAMISGLIGFLQPGQKHGRVQPARISDDDFHKGLDVRYEPQADKRKIASPASSAARIFAAARAPADSADELRVSHPLLSAVLAAFVAVVAAGVFRPPHGRVAVLASVFIGMSKTGFSGISLVSMALMAGIMPARESVGRRAAAVDLRGFLRGRFVSPARRLDGKSGGCCRRRWWASSRGRCIMRLFADPSRYPDWVFKRVIGGIVLALAALQTCAAGGPDGSRGCRAAGLPFAWLMGLIAGMTTMLANAAGPVATIYLMAIGLPEIRDRRHGRVDFPDFESGAKFRSTTAWG